MSSYITSNLIAIRKSTRLDSINSFLLLFRLFSDAINNAAYLCEQNYMASPSVEISQVNGTFLDFWSFEILQKSNSAIHQINHFRQMRGNSHCISLKVAFYPMNNLKSVF